MDRKQRRTLDRMLKERGISKQQFLHEQQARLRAAQIEGRYVYHPCVVTPTDPVSGAVPFKSLGQAPNEFHYGLLYPGAPTRRMWIEWPYRIILFQRHAGGRHACFSPEYTMWASCSI